ncbi:uncharacterized protein TRIREDRAFT_122724 [Trichoderma reesei QM6a]|jgi:tetratricopeptide (TPR) repeat protein|uniref:Predicted protein n=1 Tax=Hypocrea jecorina (strain QM6a) TaxID=431241 RepID=G0RNU3_HYPJQ|nr:uncharacterized protein TRIREDRAFT_122724 [Trichoderma reesei QM6a]EGR47332.1 predicted protein [Trichoderma reesei QM6a]
MAEALAAIGAIAAGLQLAEGSARALIKTIRIINALREVPQKLARYFQEIEASTTHVEHLCRNLLQDESKFYQQLKSLSHTDGLIKTLATLHEATEEVNEFLLPFAEFAPSPTAIAKPGRWLWKSITSLKMEKDLPHKLKRLERLNGEVIRELTAVGLQVQMATHKLMAANNSLSIEGFASIGAQLTELAVGVRTLSLAVAQSQPVDIRSNSFDHVSATSSAVELLDDCDTWSNTSSETFSESSMYKSSWQKVPSQSSTSQTVAQRKEQLRLHLQQGLSSSLTVTPRDTPTDAHLHLALLSIRTFYTKGNFDPEPQVLQPRFWKDCSNSIYFFKISDFPKARMLLQQSTAMNSDDIFLKGSVTALIEILSVLSPINTVTNPDVRKTMLRYLHALALQQLPRQSPIMVVLSRLHEGMDSTDWSMTALTCIVDRLCASLAPSNEVRLLAQRRLIALLRRNKDYDGALRVCTKALDDIRKASGPMSLQERKTARLLEHIYMDQEDWVSALEVCFDIVEQRFDETTGFNPDPQCHDECAVWTMEDIAKIYENSGNLEAAIAWLKQARISGGICWGPDVSLGHIHDKLVVLLERCELHDEAKLWSTAFGPAMV